MALLVGVDVGTGSIKAALYDSISGQIVGSAVRPTIAKHPRPAWSEFDPEDIWAGVVDTVREAVGQQGDDVVAIGIASMGEAGVPLGASGRILHPFIAWHDPRTEQFPDWWAGRCDPQWLFEITGLAPRHIYGLNKLLWLRQHQPAVFAQTRHWLSVEDFVLYRLTDRLVTDYSMASRTMAFDQRRCQWSPEVLSLAGVGHDLWPEALPSGSALGPLIPAAAAATGLDARTVVVTGGHDHLCAAFAAGLVGPGVLLDSMGTAQALLAVAPSFQPLPGLRQAGLSCYHYVVRDRYVVQAGLSAAGGSLAWLAGLLGSETGAESEFDTLLAQAEAAAPGARGLLWLPHLLGSGSPENDPDSRGALLGLTTSHSRGEIVRALLEALCYWLRQNVALLEGQLGEAMREVIVVGGITKSALVRQMKADVTGLPVRVPAIVEAAALGAALLAGIGSGIFSGEAAALASMRRRDAIYQPDAGRTTFYEPLYRDLYLKAYAQLRDLNHALARAQRALSGS